MQGMIEVTGVNLRDLIQAVYAESKPQGLGFLHARAGRLAEEEVDSILSHDKGTWNVFSMDYVNGRSCKFHVQREDGRLWINERWYDHSQEQLQRVLDLVGVSALVPN